MKHSPLLNPVRTRPAARLSRSNARLAILATSSMTMFGFAIPAQAQLTRAGVIINNTATASYDDAGGNTTTVDSNTVSLRVDELLDVAVASANSADIITTPGASSRLLTFRVTNTGNGEEAFRLSANASVSGNAFTPVIERIAIDSDGDGVYDPAADQTYVAGGNDPLIAAESAATVFVITRTPPGIADGSHASVSLTAAAVTGTGPAGTVFAGRGTGGGDAITGASTADDAASGTLRVSAATIDVVKSAVIADQFGGSSAVPGATITYTLDARATGSGSVVNLRIGDDVPVGTTYLPASMRVDGTAVTDAADSDAGAFAANRVGVTLGNVAGGQQHVVTFKVRIN